MMQNKIAKDEKPYILSNMTVNYILGLIESLLFLRFIFKFAGANSGAGIVKFIYQISDLLMAPFLYIFPTTRAGDVRLEWSVLVAMAIYAFAVYGLVGLLGIVKTADTEKVNEDQL